MNNVYPSIEELIPPIMLTKLPALLVQEMTTRYETLGAKYVTEQLTVDGRNINAMMFTSRIGNCLEEVVDAAFCILGWMFKSKLKYGIIPDNAYPALDMLIAVYSLLSAELDIERAGPDYEGIDL